MRFTVGSFIAAMMLVTLAVASSRSSSHKEGGKQRHHSSFHLLSMSQDEPITFLAAAATSAAPTWHNISTFPFRHRRHQVGGSSSSSISSISSSSISSISSSSSSESLRAMSKEKRRRKKKKSFKTRWAEKYKRKHNELMSLMEMDRLALQVPTAKKLPEMPTGLECCPTIVEVITTLGGVDRNGMIVELMRFDDNVGQKFYEISCRNDVVDKPCRFIEKMLRPVSRCVQQYTYAYGAVKKKSTVRFEYIRVRSGCACEILPSDL